MKFLEKIKVLNIFHCISLRYLLAGASLGVITGIIIVTGYLDIASRCSVAFVAREELLNLERERIKASGEDDLFFGVKGGKLQKIISNVVAKYHHRRVKIIYSNYGGIMGDNVYSISEEVHAEVVKLLKETDSKAGKND